MRKQTERFPDPTDSELNDPVRASRENRAENRCSKCGGRLDFTGACTKCGLISEIPAMSRKPQKFIDSEESQPRADRSTGRNPRFTRNGTGHTSFRVKPGLDPEKARLFRRLKRINGQKCGKTKRETRILIILDKLAELLDLSDALQRRVASLYRKLRRKGLTQGRESRATLGALTLIESRESGFPRTQWEIVETLNKLPSLSEELKPGSASESQVERYMLRNALKCFREEFGIEVSPTKPIQYLPRFATKLGLTLEETEKARGIFRQIKGELKGVKPTLVTSAILYLASPDKTLDEVSKKLHVSKSSLCNRANEVKEIIEERVGPRRTEQNPKFQEVNAVEDLPERLRELKKTVLGR